VSIILKIANSGMLFHLSIRKAQMQINLRNGERFKIVRYFLCWIMDVNIGISGTEAIVLFKFGNLLTLYVALYFYILVLTGG
jgi:hypothetical protein